MRQNLERDAEFIPWRKKTFWGLVSRYKEKREGQDCKSLSDTPQNYKRVRKTSRVTHTWLNLYVAIKPYLNRVLYDIYKDETPLYIRNWIKKMEPGYFVASQKERHNAILKGVIIQSTQNKWKIYERLGDPTELEKLKSNIQQNMRTF